jgi:antitoxin component of MazEF toxin-antitoxin module
MIKTLVRHGNSYALVIDRPILDLLKIDPDSLLEVSTDGKSIRVAPVEPSSRQVTVRAARKKINDKYKKAFKMLSE